MLSFIKAIISISLLVLSVSGTLIQNQKRDENLPARVPYVFPAPGTDPIADAIRARRNGTLLALDGALLNAPQIASTWNDLANVIRDNNTIPAQMRELMILRSGVVNNAAYVWLQHEPVARSTGLTTAQLLEIRMTPAFLGPLTPKSTLSKELQAALLFADWSSKNVHVPQPVFNGLKQFLNNKQIVEAVSTVGFYNFVSRFVVSLNVDGKMDTAVPIPS